MPSRQRIDTRALLRNRKQAHGESGLLWPARAGAIYLAKDEAIDFPENEDRENHPFRHVIVVQAWRFCVNTPPKTMLVVPCSKSHRGAVGDWDFEVPSGEAGFTAERVVAYLSLVQPILKSEMHEHLGQLKGPALLRLQQKLLSLMGVVAADTGIGPLPTGNPGSSV